MFFSISKKQQKIIELEEKIQTLKSQEDKLLKSIEKLKQEQTAEITKAVDHFQFAVDFEKMGAFSIERVIRDGSNIQTVIGYFVGGGVKEWHLQTSAKEHNRLVAEFELRKENKK